MDVIPLSEKLEMGISGVGTETQQSRGSGLTIL